MKIITINRDAPEISQLQECARTLQDNSMAAYPTDTFYGIGGNAFARELIEKIYRVKRRSREKPLILLVGNMHQFESLTKDRPAFAYRLARDFWPGPLTLILPKKAGLPENLSREDTIAVRIPDNPIARRFIAKAGGAIAATSANHSGDTPACTAQEALAALGDFIAAVLDGGPVEHSQASTILDCTILPPKIIRPGPISAEALDINS